MIAKDNVVDPDAGSEAAAPAIEITPAMIEAGVAALSSHWTALRSAADGAVEETVRDVLRAAARVRLDQLCRR
jgi:hypothetical protein